MALPRNKQASGALIPYTAPPHVQGVISAMGRTEDAAFSPDYKRLAVAGFTRDRLFLYSIRVRRQNGTKTVEIENCGVIRAKCLHQPHGIAFIGNDHLVVANRDGYIHILKIPDGLESGAEAAIRSSAQIKGGRKCPVRSPGSIACLELGPGHFRLLACNNYIHTVTSHTVELGGRKITVANEGVLIQRGLSIPDGICISPDRNWIAVSNHSTGTVLVYEFSPDLARGSKPAAMLHGIVCPHALRFSQTGERLFVADSASPYLHVYERPGEGWHSICEPWKSIRLLDEATFLRGRYNAQEGGAKGIEIDHRENLLAVTSEHLPLAFYDLDAVMAAPPLTIDNEIKEKSLQRDFNLL
jgi:WD40 repeat protein